MIHNTGKDISNKIKNISLAVRIVPSNIVLSEQPEILSVILGYQSKKEIYVSVINDFLRY